MANKKYVAHDGKKFKTLMESRIHNDRLSVIRGALPGSLIRRLVTLHGITPYLNRYATSESVKFYGRPSTAKTQKALEAVRKELETYGMTEDREYTIRMLNIPNDPTTKSVIIKFKKEHFEDV